MEDFSVATGIDNAGIDDSSIEIVAIIFPAEYASVRDRPGMKEALELLETALNSHKDKEEKPWWKFWAQDSSSKDKETD